MLSLYQTVGQRILEVLSKRNWTQQYLADQLGVSKQVMSKILKGDKKTTIAEISKIAEILRVTVDELLTPVQEIVYPLQTEEDLAVAFMGKASTDAGKTGIRRAFDVIDLFITQEQKFFDYQIRNQEIHMPTKKVRSFVPEPFIEQE